MIDLSQKYDSLVGGIFFLPRAAVADGTAEWKMNIQR
jgi:hypothetical protein